MKLNKSRLFTASLITIIGVLAFSLLYPFDWELLSLKAQASSINVGDRYQGRLGLFYYFASRGDWVTANQLATKLNPADTKVYRQAHDPQLLKKALNELAIKANKTPDDLVELARIQSILGKTDDVSKTLTKARSLDPVRDDISSLYFQLVR